jgi:branched-chain amino acid aminotransferase
VEITPVVSIDRYTLGDGKPGPVTKRIQQQFMSIVTGRAPDPHHWLTPVPVAAGAASR